jgi:hypothetical protein
MRRVTVFDHVRLDGVMQAPGRADEDCRDDFRHGGWSPPYGDEVMGGVMARERRKYVASRTLQEPLPGSGRRLFESGGTYAALRLVDAKPTTTGVIIATYATS